MPLSIVHFLYQRGPRLAASKAEATALRYIENQFETFGVETSSIVFPSFGGMEWYYALSYCVFPLATIMFVESIPLALALVTLGLVLLRLDLFIWPKLNRILAWTSRSRTVTGRVRPQREPHQTVIVTANADSRRVLGIFHKWPFLEHLGPVLMNLIDFTRVVHWLLYLVAIVFNVFSMRDQVQMMWRLSWISGVLCLLTGGFYLAQAMHGRPLDCANDNLTGLQVLVDAAANFAAEPCQRTELIFAAVGSGRAGMLGTHFLMRALKPDKDNTILFNLSSLGSGRVAMAGSEGWTRPVHASDELTDLGYLIGSTTPLPLEVVSTRQRRSDCTMARSMGYQAMTLVGLQPHGRPGFKLSDTRINTTNLEHTQDCVQRMIHTIDYQA